MNTPLTELPRVTVTQRQSDTRIGILLYIVGTTSIGIEVSTLMTFLMLTPLFVGLAAGFMIIFSAALYTYSRHQVVITELSLKKTCIGTWLVGSLISALFALIAQGMYSSATSLLPMVIIGMLIVNVLQTMTMHELLLSTKATCDVWEDIPREQFSMVRVLLSLGVQALSHSADRLEMMH